MAPRCACAVLGMGSGRPGNLVPCAGGSRKPEVTWVPESGWFWGTLGQAPGDGQGSPNTREGVRVEGRHGVRPGHPGRQETQCVGTFYKRKGRGQASKDGGPGIGCTVSAGWALHGTRVTSRWRAESKPGPRPGPGPQLLSRPRLMGAPGRVLPFSLRPRARLLPRRALMGPGVGRAQRTLS